MEDVTSYVGIVAPEENKSSYHSNYQLAEERENPASNYNYKVLDEFLPLSPSPAVVTTSLRRPPPPPSSSASPLPKAGGGVPSSYDQVQEVSNYSNYGSEASKYVNYGNDEKAAPVSHYSNYGGEAAAAVSNYSNYGGEAAAAVSNYSNYGGEAAAAVSNYSNYGGEGAPASEVKHHSPPPVVHRKWAEELSELRKIPGLPERRRRLVEWHEALVSTAVLHAASIISCLHDPVKLASMAAAMGGIAGGTKFIFDGLVFKLATDPKMATSYLYGGGKLPSPERAAKAASQELKGANSLFECIYEQKLDITVPMQVLIDYCGERLVAMPLLPIKGSETLVYGSCDGGRTVLADVQIHQYLNGVCGQLHLAEHAVGSDGGVVKLWLAGDVEGHRGSDGKLYLLDLARTFPPEDPRLMTHLPPCGSAVWFRLTRPEFLRILKRENLPALSSDSFTQWGRPDMSHNERARKATEFLLNEQIPRFAWHLASFLNSASFGNSSSLRQSFSKFPEAYAQALLKSPITAAQLFKSLAAHTGQNQDVPAWADSTTFYPPNYIASLDFSKEFHDHGLPMRHLGLVHEAVFAPELKLMLLREGVARSFKNLIRAELRECQKTEAKMALDVAITWFNVIMRGPAILQGKISASEQERAKVKHIWEKVLPEDVLSRFGSVLSYGIGSFAAAVEAQKFWIIEYLIQSIGITVTSVCKQTKLLSDDLCPKSHALVIGLPGRKGVRCDLCKQLAAGDEAGSCSLCNFDCCARCLGKTMTTLTSKDIVGFEPRKKNMSFINAIQAQCLSDQAMRLVEGPTESLNSRRVEFLNLMQQVRSLCENLLRTDPNCLPIKEQLRCATLAVALLAPGNTADKRTATDGFLLNFLAEVSATGGVISDGLKLMAAAGAIGDPLLIAKAAKFQNLLPLRALVDAGGELGYAVSNALDLGNREAVGYLLSVMKQRYRSPPADPHLHFMRKHVGANAYGCHHKHDFLLKCSQCKERFCEHNNSIAPQSAFLNTQILRFHCVSDVALHPHSLVLSKYDTTRVVCRSCNKSGKSLMWLCNVCPASYSHTRVGFCSGCLEPNLHAFPNPVLAPTDTTAIDDAMLVTLGSGLQDNHAFSTLALIGMRVSNRGMCEFLKCSKFSSSLTSLNLSANPLTTTGVRELGQALSAMHLRELSLCAMGGNFARCADLFSLSVLGVPIETLKLSHNSGFGDEFIAQLKKNVKASSPLRNALKRLDLKHTDFTHKGVVDLLSLEWKLDVLKVSANKIGNPSILLLARAPLRVLHASSTDLSPSCYNELSDLLIASQTLQVAKFWHEAIPLGVLRGPRPSETRVTLIGKCPKGHLLLLGANVPKYTGPNATCDVCRAPVLTQDAFSCAICSYDTCPRCFNEATVQDKYINSGDIFNVNCRNDDSLSNLTIAKMCSLRGYSYVRVEGGRIIPLISTLKLQAVDFRARLLHSRHISLYFGQCMADSLQRLAVSFEHADNDAVDINVLLSQLSGRPNLTDLSFGSPPINDQFFELIRQGKHLRRLSLRWSLGTHHGDQRAAVASLGPLAATLQYLKLKHIRFDSDSVIEPYTGQQDHVFHCLTGPAEIELKSMRVEYAACSALFQAVACNRALTTLDFSLSEFQWQNLSANIAHPIATAIASVFEKCTKLTDVTLREILYYNEHSHFVDKFVELALPALEANPSIKCLRIKPSNILFLDRLGQTLKRRPGMLDLKFLDRTRTRLPYLPFVTKLAPKFRGLNLYDVQYDPEAATDCLKALLNSGTTECKERAAPLHTLALGGMCKDFTVQQVTLCAQIFANPVLCVSEICLHAVNFTSEWFSALKQCHSLTLLDVSAPEGQDDTIDFAGLVEVVVHAKHLVSLNIERRRPEQGEIAAFLVTIIEGNPGLRDLYADCSVLSHSDYVNVVTAAAQPRSSLLNLMLRGNLDSVGTEIAIQEILWNCPKPLLFMPIPTKEKAVLLHWVRMDRLGAPVFSQPRQCHGA